MVEVKSEDLLFKGDISRGFEEICIEDIHIHKQMHQYFIPKPHRLKELSFPLQNVRHCHTAEKRRTVVEKINILVCDITLNRALQLAELETLHLAP